MTTTAKNTSIAQEFQTHLKDFRVSDTTTVSSVIEKARQLEPADFQVWFNTAKKPRSNNLYFHSQEKQSELLERIFNPNCDLLVEALNNQQHALFNNFLHAVFSDFSHDDTKASLVRKEKFWSIYEQRIAKILVLSFTQEDTRYSQSLMGYIDEHAAWVQKNSQFQHLSKIIKHTKTLAAPDLSFEQEVDCLRRWVKNIAEYLPQPGPGTHSADFPEIFQGLTTLINHPDFQFKNRVLRLKAYTEDNVISPSEQEIWDQFVRVANSCITKRVLFRHSPDPTEDLWALMTAIKHDNIAGYLQILDFHKHNIAITFVSINDDTKLVTDTLQFQEKLQLRGLPNLIDNNWIIPAQIFGNRQNSILAQHFLEMFMEATPDSVKSHEPWLNATNIKPIKHIQNIFSALLKTQTIQNSYFEHLQQHPIKVGKIPVSFFYLLLEHSDILKRWSYPETGENLLQFFVNEMTPDLKRTKLGFLTKVCQQYDEAFAESKSPENPSVVDHLLNIISKDPAPAFLKQHQSTPDVVNQILHRSLSFQKDGKMKQLTSDGANDEQTQPSQPQHNPKPPSKNRL